MKTYLVMVGRTNNTWIDTGIRDYFQRISHYIPFRDIVIHEIKKSKNLPEKEIKNKEGELILKTVSSGDILVLLDENGQHYNSRGFSGFLEQQMIKVYVICFS